MHVQVDNVIHHLMENHCPSLARTPCPQKREEERGGVYYKERDEGGIIRERREGREGRERYQRE